MKLTFLGTGDARQVPVFGCNCHACEAARNDQTLRRRPCSALLEFKGVKLLLDGGLTDLAERFRPGELNAILLTHYHVDHVQGLFHLRWGLGEQIPVFGPEDNAGCADLLKHPGILDFRKPLQPFTAIAIGPLKITPLPLQHSKPTFGYLLEAAGRRLAYLTDTVGLPKATIAFLQAYSALELVIDCSEPPQLEPPRNHNDLNLVLQTQEQLKPKAIWLTHLSHNMDGWLLDNQLPEGLYVTRDELTV
jgi:phosphoribosyl 1,2-cyclic phosphate phosphodiesterase